LRLVGAVGTDAFAAAARRLLAEAGVDLEHVRHGEAPTGTALITVDRAGENTIAIAPGANAKAAAAQLAAAGLGPNDILLLQMELPDAEVRAALAQAEAVGCRAIVNLAPYRSVGANFLSQVHVLVVNEIECEMLARDMGFGEARVDAAAEMIAALGPVVVVTLGADGALAFGEGLVRAPALPVAPVDTVGAGDAFVGYFAAGLHEGMSLDAALARASAAGSLACLAPGAQPSIPEKDQVDRVLEEAGSPPSASGDRS